MNKLNPNKLLLSKWTVVAPNKKERHFMITKIIRAKNEAIIACELEAVINKKSYKMDWRELKDTKVWRMGWE